MSDRGYSEDPERPDPTAPVQTPVAGSPGGCPGVSHQVHPRGNEIEKRVATNFK